MRNVTILLAVVAVLALAGTAWGEETWDVAGPASWHVGTNWDDNAVPWWAPKIYNGGICEIMSGNTASASNSIAIAGSLGGELRLLPGGTLTNSGSMLLSHNTGADCVFVQSGGTSTFGGNIRISYDNQNYDHRVTVSGGSLSGTSVEVSSGGWSHGTYEVKGYWDEVVSGVDNIKFSTTYTQWGKGTLKVTVDNSGNGKGITKTAVTGVATFAGTLNVVDDSAAVGVYTLMTYSSRATAGNTSTFATVTKGGDWNAPVYGDTALTIEKVPEPATMVLLGLGGIGVLLRRRRK